MADDNETPMAACWGKHPTTPLICTFKFPGKEFWCPACGRTYGYFEPRAIRRTKTRQNKLDKLRTAAKPFLDGETDKWKYTHKNTR
jgi:hypothetical protein